MYHRTFLMNMYLLCLILNQILIQRELHVGDTSQEGAATPRQRRPYQINQCPEAV